MPAGCDTFRSLGFAFELQCRVRAPEPHRSNKGNFSCLPGTKGWPCPKGLALPTHLLVPRIKDEAESAVRWMVPLVDKRVDPILDLGNGLAFPSPAISVFTDEPERLTECSERD